jgi:hypothetical protein
VNEREARELLAHQVDELRPVPYRELLPLLDRPQSADVVHPSGRRYQIEMEAVWDEKPGENLRIVVSIDDGGWRAFAPLTSGFIKTPNDQFVGEQ